MGNSEPKKQVESTETSDNQFIDKENSVKNQSTSDSSQENDSHDEETVEDSTKNPEPDLGSRSPGTDRDL